MKDIKIKTDSRKTDLMGTLYQDLVTSSEEDQMLTLNLMFRLSSSKNFYKVGKILETLENKLNVETRPDLDFYLRCKIYRSELEVFIRSLRNVTVELQHVPQEKVPWFPRQIQDLDRCQQLVTKFDPDMDQEHPGFNDSAYLERRRVITEMAFTHTQFDPLPVVNYTAEEVSTWGQVYRQLRGVYPRMACRQFLNGLHQLETECGYGEKNIPQIRDVSAFLKGKTGFQLRPVAGLLSARDFLASLAFRVFQCTQYIRHGSAPMHSPEPDCCHELLGHIPMLADPEFAQFSQEMGLASLGASDEDIQKLSTLYWFTVEFGLISEDGEMKAYGAGLLSSYGELMYSLSNQPHYKDFVPDQMILQSYQDQTYQPLYYVSHSLQEVTHKLRKYWSSLRRPFSVRYDASRCSVEVTTTNQSC